MTLLFNNSLLSLNKLSIKKKAAIFSFLLIIPSILFIFLDKSLWSSDCSLYGWQANILADEIGSPVTFFKTLFSFQPKPPLLQLFGSFFSLLGGIINRDTALLLTISVFQFLSLYLLYLSAYKISKDNKVSLLAILFLSGSILFVQMGTSFYVQMPQLFVVSWFLYIFVSASEKNSAWIFFNLLAASSTAILAMLSTPAFVLIPALYATFKMIKGFDISEWMNKESFLMSIPAFIIFLLAAIWVVLNIESSIDYALYSLNYRWAGIYADNFHDKLFQWSLNVFYASPLSVIMSLIIFLAAIFQRKLTGFFKNRPPYILVSLLQLLFVLFLFSRSAHQEYRYILPLLIYINIILVSLLKSKSKLLTLSMLIALFQYGVSYFEVYKNIQIDYPENYVATRKITNYIASDACKNILLATGKLNVYSNTVMYELSKEENFYHSDLKINSLEFLLTYVDADYSQILDKIEVKDHCKLFTLNQELLKNSLDKVMIDSSSVQWVEIENTTLKVTEHIYESDKYNMVESSIPLVSVFKKNYEIDVER